MNIKFVKNRFVMYSAKYKHMGYGHHGKNINDAVRARDKKARIA